jgi:hypothetical protein
MATGLGTGPEASWDEIGQAMEQKVRAEIADAAGIDKGATWEDIGREVESHLKEGLGGWAGASSEDDWSTLGSKITAKMQSILDKALKTETKGEDVPDPSLDSDAGVEED